MTGIRDIALVVTDTAWMADAACARSRIDMFPTTEYGVDRALAVCELCRCRTACREYALANRINDGVWGSSERERRAILKRRRRGAA